MTIEPSGGEMQRFVLDIDYAPNERDDIERIARQIAEARTGTPSWFIWLILGAGVVLAFAGTMVLAHMGVVEKSTASLVAALSFGLFFLGLWLPNILGYVLAGPIRRHRDRLAPLHWNDIRVVVDHRGIRIHRPFGRAFLTRAAIRSVSVKRSLLVIESSMSRPIAIPMRALSPEQRAFVLSLAPQSR